MLDDLAFPVDFKLHTWFCPSRLSQINDESLFFLVDDESPQGKLAHQLGHKRVYLSGHGANAGGCQAIGHFNGNGSTFRLNNFHVQIKTLSVTDNRASGYVGGSQDPPQLGRSIDIDNPGYAQLLLFHDLLQRLAFDNIKTALFYESGSEPLGCNLTQILRLGFLSLRFQIHHGDPGTSRSMHVCLGGNPEKEGNGQNHAAYTHPLVWLHFWSPCNRLDWEYACQAGSANDL